MIRGDVPKPDRRAYLEAVLCLSKAPSKLDSKKFPGAKSRYDDFVVVHMNQTLNIHGTGNFLSWHRYYIWSWENVLRKECGYKGTLPVCYRDPFYTLTVTGPTPIYVMRVLDSSRLNNYLQILFFLL